MFFFDSYGTMWGTCRADEPGAMAFGPAIAARDASDWADIVLGTQTGGAETAYAAAKRLGRVDESGEWPVLL